MEYRQTHMFKKPDSPSETSPEKEVVDDMEWEGMVSGGTYREESDRWISYKNGKWFVNGKEALFQEILSDYGSILKHRAGKDELLRELLKKEEQI